jgi:hypothetical protein
MEAVRRMSDRYDLVVTRYCWPCIQLVVFKLTTIQWRHRPNVGSPSSRRFLIRLADRWIFYRHDDITYQSIAKAFGVELILHDEAYEKMKKLSKPNKALPDFSWDVESPAKTARLRMVQLPIDKSRDVSKQVLCE